MRWCGSLPTGGGPFLVFLQIRTQWPMDDLIIQENSEFLEIQNYLESELDDIFKGKASFIDMHEAEKRLEEIVYQTASMNVCSESKNLL